MLEQVAWGSCGISILGDVQDLIGCGPAQPDLTRLDVLWAKVVLDGLRRSLPIWITWCCEWAVCTWELVCQTPHRMKYMASYWLCLRSI